jgi:hypothetical protein
LISRLGLGRAADLGRIKAALAVFLCLSGYVVVHGVEWLRLLLVLVLLATSTLLSSAREGAAKSRALGRVMALLGASLSLRLVSGLPGVTVWRAVHPEAFVGAAALDFAATFRKEQRSLSLAQLAMAWGTLDALLRLVLGLATWFGVAAAGSVYQILPRWDWVPTYLLALLAVHPLLRALGDSTGAEQRQLKLFVYGLTIGVAPFVLILPAGAVVPNFNEWLVKPDVQPVFLALTYPLLFVFPITATYAVLYQGALDYQSALRRAAQYALARYTLLALVALPLGAGVAFLYANRAEPLGDLLTGWRFLALATVAAGAAVAFPLRYRLLAGLDRRYFREAYDARRVLRELTEKVRKTPDLSELSRLLVEQVDTALHVESVVVMTASPEQPGLLRTASARGVPEPEPITASAQFVSLLAGSSDPLPVDAAGPGSLMARLPDREKEWLKSAGASLLVPLHGSGEALTGFMVLGLKKSEIPFSEEDRDLLASVGGAAGMSIETRLLRATPTPGGGGSTPPRDETPPARECLACLKVFESTVLSCVNCGAATQPALLPLALLDKYRLESRLGSGGFGVVYAATEVRLGRRVALKTLPRISGERVERFKREALAAAAIQHPNLAMIHTAESWNETPILVFELLEGGTLAQRLMEDNLSVPETVQLGRAMASVLEEAHQRGILHRDIKPSNIGYDARGNPKLLDFGVARIREPSTTPSPHAVDTITLARSEKAGNPAPPTQDAPLTETGAIVGTPAYLPLEAYQNREPGPALDLWALSVTLYEALTGINPFRAPSPAETIELLLRKDPTPLQVLRPDCPPGFAEWLGRALSRAAMERPQTAAEMRNQLETFLDPGDPQSGGRG